MHLKANLLFISLRQRHSSSKPKPMTPYTKPIIEIAEKLLILRLLEDIAEHPSLLWKRDEKFNEGLN
jgi:hypothetical protein